MSEMCDRGDLPTAAVKVDFSSLTAYLQRDPRVAAALVFGSGRDGWVRPGSDLDLAVLFESPLSAGDFLQFYTDLCDHVPNVEKIDLVRLNQANPILAFEVLNGRFLCINNREKMADCFSLVCREYEDVMGNLEHQKQLVA